MPRPTTGPAELLAEAEAAIAREAFATAYWLIGPVLDATGDERVRRRCWLGLARIQDAWENGAGVAAMVGAAGIRPDDALPAADEALAALHEFAERAASGDNRPDDALAHAQAALRVRLSLLSGTPPAASVTAGDVAAALARARDPGVSARLASGATRMAALLAFRSKTPAVLNWSEAILPTLHRPEVVEVPALCHRLRSALEHLARNAPQNAMVAELLARLPIYPPGQELAAYLADPARLLFEVDTRFRTNLGPLDPDAARLVETAVPEFETRGLVLSAAHGRALRARARLAQLLYPDPAAFRLPSNQLPSPRRVRPEALDEATRDLEGALNALHQCVPRLDWRLWTTFTALSSVRLQLGDLEGAGFWGRQGFAAAAGWAGSLARPASALGTVAEASGADGLAAFWAKVVMALEAEAVATHGGTIPALERTFVNQVAWNRDVLSDLLAAQGRLGEAHQASPPGFAPRGRSDLAQPHWTAGEAATWSALRAALSSWRDAPAARQAETLAALVDLLESLSIPTVRPAPADPDEALQALKHVHDAMAAESRTLPADVALVRHMLLPGRLDEAEDGDVVETVAVLTARAGETDGKLKGLRPGLASIARFVLTDMGTHPEHPTARRGTPEQVALGHEMTQALHFLMAEVVRQSLSGAEARLLLVASDGPLRFLPLGALGSDRPLVEDVAIAELGADLRTSGVTLFRGRARPSRPPRLAALGVADHARHGQPDLHAVVDEIGTLLPAFPGSPRPRFDAEAGRAGLEALLAEDADLLHVATHLDANYADPGESRLLLGNGESLRLAELARRDLSRYALITLSSCSSGVPAGPELHSPADLLLDAGTGAVLASSWPVEDAPTAALMKRFYAELASAAAPSKAEALRRAQLATRAEWPHPYYWAGFRLWGDWRALRA